MSFGRSMFLAGFIQKAIKGDLFIKENYKIPSRNQRGKTLEHFGRQLTEVEPEGLPCEAGQPHLQGGRPMGPTSQPSLRKSVLHRLLGCIYIILSSWFDPRVHN
jgi:hypothetical protein